MNIFLSYGPNLPSSVKMFYINMKGCKDMYDILINRKKETSTSILKWNEKGYLFTMQEWSKIFELPFKITKESKLQWLQFQILHRIVPTNLYLFKLKIKESPACSFCKTDIESNKHVCVECNLVKDLWSDIEEWFLCKFNISVIFDRTTILFGKHKNKDVHKVQNLMTLITKNYIFSTKYKNPSVLSIMTLKTIIVERFLIEKFLLLKQCKYTEYENNWQSICDMI